MHPQQQTVVTGAAPVQPVYVSQPYQTASVVNSYGHRQSTVIGILLLVAGCLSIIFNIVDLAIGTKDEYTSYYYLYGYEHSLSNESNGVAGHGFWCGVLVSVASLHTHTHTRLMALCPGQGYLGEPVPKR